jgi:hypothetical protein
VVSAFLSVTKPAVADVLSALDPEGDDENKYEMHYDDDEHGDADDEHGDADDNEYVGSEEDGASGDTPVAGTGPHDLSHCVLGSVAASAKEAELDLMDEICKHMPANVTDAPAFLRWFLVELADIMNRDASGSIFTKLHALAAHPEGPLHFNSMAAAGLASKDAPPAHLQEHQCAAHTTMSNLLTNTKTTSGAPSLTSSGLVDQELKVHLLLTPSGSFLLLPASPRSHHTLMTTPTPRLSYRH